MRTSFILFNEELEWNVDCNILRSPVFVQFLTTEKLRLSQIPHRGEMNDDHQAIRTRALYFEVFMFFLSQLCVNKQSGMSSNVTIPVPFTSHKLTITRVELLILWFFLFNFGHFQDTKSAERFVLYQLWRECTPFDQGLTTSATDVLYTDDIPKHQAVNFDYRLPASKKSVRASLKQTGYSGMLSPVAADFLQGFPQRSKDYATSVIMKGRWAQFHHVLAVWRTIHFTDQSIHEQIELTIDDKLGKISLQQLFLAALEEFGNQNLNLKLTTDITTLSVVRMLSYLNMDPPQDSIFTLSMTSLAQYLRTDRHCVSRLYDQLDLRGKQLIDQNDFYFNSVCMHPFYVEKQCRCILFMQDRLMDTLQPEVSNELITSLFNVRVCAEEKYLKSPALQYSFSLPFPTTPKGDLDLYRHLNREWRVSKIYIVQWMGHTKGSRKNSFTECYFFFSPKTKRLYKYFRSLAMAWIAEHDSIYLGAREVFRELPVPITRITNSIVDFIFRKATNCKNIVVHPELHESNRITELPWTLCWGYSDALQSIQEAYHTINSRLSMLNKHKGMKYESFGLAKAFGAMTLQADTDAFFIVLWGGLQIEIEDKKREFDFCWLCINESDATIYVGEYKSGNEDALKCTKEKLEYLGIHSKYHVVQKPRCCVASITEISDPILQGENLLNFLQSGRIQHYSRYHIEITEEILDSLLLNGSNTDKMRAVYVISKMGYDKHGTKVKQLIESISDVDLDQRDAIIKFITSLESPLYSNICLSGVLVQKLAKYFKQDLKKNRTFLKTLLQRCDLSGITFGSDPTTSINL